MNTNLPVPNDGQWPVERFPATSAETGRSDRSYSAANILDFPTLVRIIVHWRWLIAGATGLGLAIGLLTTLLMPAVYRAWVTIEVNPPTVEVGDENMRGEKSQPVNNTDVIATEVGLIQSRSVAQRAAQDLNLANNAVLVQQNLNPSERLQVATSTVSRGLRVNVPQDGRLIRFSFESRSPELAASVANGIADSLINTELQRRYESSAYARNFLERQISKTRSDLERSERSLVAYAQAQGIINTTGADGQQGQGDTGSLQGESLVKLNEALADATAHRVAAEGAYRQSLATGPTSDVTQSTMALQQQLAQLQSQYSEKRTFLKPDHPEMVSLRSQIDELRRQISQAQGQMRSGHSNSLLADYRAALSAERALQERVAQLKGAVLNLRGRSIQYTILQRDVDTNRALYDALLQRYKQIGVAGGVGLAPVSIVDRADVPRLPFKPNLFLNLVLGVSLGFIAGLAGAIGLEFINDTIKTREDVRKKLLLACVGTVPWTSAKEGFVEEFKNPTSATSEAYSAIVAALGFSTEAGMPKVLLLTSTRSGEGKSSSALALAQNFARRGKSVLLIDADLRKPAFKAARADLGLSKLLVTSDAIDDHIMDTQHGNLSILPSGPIPPNPADLLSTGRIRRIIAQAREQFDLVVIDGPPTIGLADAPLLAAASGNILFIVESGKTRTRLAVEAINRLQSTGTLIVGAVLTKSTERATYGYGRYGYGYGGGKLRHTPEIQLIADRASAVDEEAPSEERAD